MDYSILAEIKQATKYTEFQLIKALDDWIFQAYGISQPVHQKIIRYWARRINNNSKMKRQIRQGETVGVKDATTAEKVECSTKVVAECRRLAKKVGLLNYQRRHNQIGVWVMYFSCMIKPKPTEIEDDDGVISGVFVQEEKAECESSQVPQSTLSQVHLSEVSEAENAVSDSVSEIDDDFVQEQVYNKNNTNTTTKELRNSIKDHANEEKPVVEDSKESKELIKGPKMSTKQQTALFKVWKLNRIRNKREIAKHHHQKHYQQIVEVVEWAILKKYCTSDDAADKLRPIFDKATSGFSVPIGLIRSDEGRQLFTDAFPAQESTKLSPNDPSFYDQEAMDETRTKHKQQAAEIRQSRERDEPYRQKIHAKVDEIHQRSKPAPEISVGPKQVEVPVTNDNGGGDDVPGRLTKEEKRERYNQLYGQDRFKKIQSSRKSGFGTIDEAISETKRKIKEAQSTQMDLFNWSKTEEGDTSETRRNDEPDQEGRVESEQPLE